MINWFRKFFKSPVLEDKDKALRAELLNVLILAVFVAVPLLVVGNLLGEVPNPFVFGAAGGAILIAWGLRWMVKWGWVYWASVIWVVLGAGFVTAGILGLGTVRATNTFIFLIIISVSGFLLSRRALAWVTVYACLAVLVLGWAQGRGWLYADPNIPPMDMSVAVNFLALFLVTAMLMSAFLRVMRKIIQNERAEVQQRRRSEQTLLQRDAIMEAVTFSAQKFLRGANWRDEIDAVLAHLGQATQSSHVFIFENHVLEDGTEVTSQRYEWTAPGIRSDMDNPLYQNTPMRTPVTEKWYGLMSSGEAYYGTRDILPDVEVRKYEQEGLMSFINVPIFVGDRWWGLIGFDDFVSKREWTPVEIHAVKVAASTLGAAIQRQLNDEALQRRDAVLQAMNDAAQQFFRSENWRENIQTALERIGKAIEASHAYIFEKHFLADGTPVISQRYEWVADGFSAELDDPLFQNIEMDGPEVDPWFQSLIQGEVRYGNLLTLSPQDVAFFQGRGIKALMEIPVIVGNEWWGVLGVDDFANLREWTVAEIDALKLAASTLGAAMQRQFSNEALRQTELRYRTELEERVLERTRQLEEALREIEGVSYTASHDLRAPVRAINGYANILLSLVDQLGEKERDYLEKIDRESRRMGNLLDDLLQLIQLNRQKMRIMQVNLSTMAQKTISQLREKFPNQHVEAEIQENLLAQGDQNMLQVVVNELLDNAWKFTETQKNPCVKIGEETQEGQRVFFVRDNGIGFDMAYVHKLFRNFEQLHLPGIYEGTGMGLAMVQRIIQRHGGKVWVQGKPNEGLTVYFTLSG